MLRVFPPSFCFSLEPLVNNQFIFKIALVNLPSAGELLEKTTKNPFANISGRSFSCCRSGLFVVENPTNSVISLEPYEGPADVAKTCQTGEGKG
jgi:hypothetical protein